MHHWKWLPIALVAAAALALSGCGGDDEGCSTDEDCGTGEICAAETGTCRVACTSGGDECDDEFGEVCSEGCGGEGSVAFCFIPCTSDDDCAPDVETCDLTFCDDQSKGLCVPVGPVSCTTNDDCGTDQLCDTAGGVCVAKCDTNADCLLGQVCNATLHMCQNSGQTGCTSDDDCGVGETCNTTSGLCEATDTCSGQQACYDQGNFFCADTGAENTCVDTSCGVAFNDCSRCTLGPNGGGRQDDQAPQIFAAGQDDIGSGDAFCTYSLDFCRSDAPILCQFHFSAFAPNAAELPTTNLGDAVMVISSSGSQGHPFHVKSTASGENRQYSFQACFPEGATRVVGTAAALTGVSGRLSNTLCMVGHK